MKKKINFLLILCLICITSNCSSVKDGLTLKKKESSQQFLIEKKKPLVMPPDYEKLPEPGFVLSENQDDKGSEESLDLEKILSSSSKTNEGNKKSNISEDIEKKILEQLK